MEHNTRPEPQSPPLLAGEGWVGVSASAANMIRPDKQQRNRARVLRKNLTDAEQRLWQALRAKQLGVKFRRQAPVGPYIVDFLSHEAMLVIEMDGGQHTETREYDAKRTGFIEEKGFRVLRFWNNEALENMQGTLTVIHEAINAQHSNQHPHPDLPPQTGEGAIDD